MIGKKFVLVILFSSLFIACGENTREEVLERYSNGSKKSVVIYEGEGTDERLVERRIYSKKGELIRLIDETEDTVQTYLHLNPRLTEPEGLEEFLKGSSWVRNEDGSKGGIYLTEDSLFYAAESSIALFIDYRSLKYLDNNKISFYSELDTRGNLSFSFLGENERDTLKVIPKSNTKIKIPDFPISSDITSNTFKRSNMDIRSLVEKKRRDPNEQ